jgi:proline racemase
MLMLNAESEEGSAVVIRAIDAHAGGQVLRLVTGGGVRPSGSTMARRAGWLARHADHLRRAVVLEPRGHPDLVAALLTEPLDAGSHAGVLFMDGQGYPSMSGHGIIAVATIIVERELFFARDRRRDTVPLRLETVAGPIGAMVRVHDRGGTIRADSVAFSNVPAYVHAPGVRLRVGDRDLRVDIAYGGLFYAIVDTEAVGIPLTVPRVADLRRLALAIVAAADAGFDLAHPSAPVTGLGGVVFTGPPQDPEAHLRAVTVSRSGGVDRSPGGTGMSAVMSVLDAMGLLPEHGPFVQEGLSGTVFRGIAAGRTQAGDLPALSVQIEGTAWVTGDHTFHVDEDDPLRDGFAM